MTRDRNESFRKRIYLWLLDVDTSSPVAPVDVRAVPHERPESYRDD